MSRIQHPSIPEVSSFSVNSNPAFKMTTLLQALVINMDEDTDRFARLSDDFREIDMVRLERVVGVNTRELPRLALDKLTDYSTVNPPKGTLGCFLAHIKAWETIADSNMKWTLVLEDDALPLSFSRFNPSAIPDDAEIIFVNQRACPVVEPISANAEPGFMQTSELLFYKSKLTTLQSPPGLEGYILTRAGAISLINAVKVDGFRGHVDWRVFRYTLDKEVARSAVQSTWMESRQVISPAVDRTGWKWAILKGYCMSPPLVSLYKSASRRKAKDNISSQVSSL